MADLDNVVAGGAKFSAVLPHLGQGLPALENGERDHGLRQDIFHLDKRIFTLLPSEPGLADAAGQSLKALQYLLDTELCGLVMYIYASSKCSAALG